MVCTKIEWYLSEFLYDVLNLLDFIMILLIYTPEMTTTNGSREQAPREGRLNLLRMFSAQGDDLTYYL